MEKIKMTANVLFSGIGCQERGIENSECFDLEVINTSDIDKDAILQYAAIHCGLTNELLESYDYPSREEMVADLERMNIGYDPNKAKPYNWTKLIKSKKNDIEKYWLACKLAHNLGDISKIDKLDYADLWTISFCCQDISVAGKLKGFAPDSGSRSSLLWENIRLLKDSIDRGEAPKYLMFENVKNLVGKRFKSEFDNLVDILEDLGYNTYWKVLNAKFCGIPQNRERVFVICIRKDIDTGMFEFPAEFDSGVRLKDVLEDTVDEKYYIQNEKADTLIRNLIDNGDLPKN